jgi:hypothetical protein
MKKSLLICFAAIMSMLCKAQTTYYWIGGTGATSVASFTSNSNSSPRWNTALNGSGTNRAIADPTDILIIDGTNVGGATATTGPITATCSSTAFGQLVLRNGANLTIIRATTGTGSITINGDATAGDDLLVNFGCSLTIGVADSVSTTSGNNMLLTANASGRIFGTLFLNRGASRITAANPIAGGSLIFENGALCKANTEITYFSFGSTSGVPNAVVFNSGSKLTYIGGNSPFTTSSTYMPVDFKSGSTFRIETVVPNVAVTSSNLFSAKRFSNLEIGNNQTVIGDFLTIDAGSTFYLKATGSSPFSGNIINNGTFGAVAGFTSSNLLMKGIAAQSIGGTGIFQALGSFTVGAASDVTLNANLVLNGTSNTVINSKINFTTHAISGTGTFQTKAAATVSTNVTAGNIGANVITLDAAAYNSTTNTAGVSLGLFVTGTGIPANSFIIGTSSSASTITISNPLTAVPPSITVFGSIPSLRTANTNGIDGSIGGMATLSITSATDFIYDASTTQPFSSISLGTVRNVTFNAPATTNRTVSIDSALTINAGILSIRPSDTIRIRNGKPVGGAPFNNSKYIATVSNSTSTGKLRIDLISSSTLFPIGSPSYYLPITLSPLASSNMTASVFEGITSNGSLTGPLLTPTELLPLVNAVWIVGRVSGSGDFGVNIKWNQSLEGSLFSTQANSRLGVIQNSGTAWGVPFGTGDNTINSADATATTPSSFGVGSQPLMTPFAFNSIAPKTYGDADFSSGVTSLNTTQPVVYTSSNPAVATISSTGLIQIVGVGTTDINASQATDGNYLAANETQQLVVNKAALTITADNKTKFEGAANPVLTATYTGFVNGESESVLQTPVSLATTATIASVSGTYPITPSAATAENYNISFVDGVLNVVGRITPIITFNSIPAVTYGDADFNANASSDNNTVPVVLTSSNNNIVSILNGNIIHITGAGTATVTASQAGSGGYLPAADITITIIVNKAPLNITVLDTVKLQGNPNPDFRFIYSGFVYNETATVLSNPVSVNTNATVNSAPGIYTISPNGAASNNYSFTYVEGKLTVYPQDSSLQTINAYHNGNGQLIIKIYSPSPDLGAVMLYDQQGRYLGKKDIFVVQGFTSTQLDISNLATAYYIVAFRGKKSTISKLISVIK